LNRLRALAPVNALGGILDALELVLARTGDGLLAYAKDWRGDSKEAEIIRGAGAAYVRVLIPFLRRAVLQGVFGAPYEREAEKDGNVDMSQVNSKQVAEGSNALEAVLTEWESWLADASP
ncbi:hypothetical protein HYDPIDRAFT_171647, partial [Hydnomerulius pinastri MD-312]